MLRTDTPMSNYSQCEEEENPDQDWVHLPPMQQPENPTVMQAESVTVEGTVGETTAPLTSGAVDPIRGETLRDRYFSDGRCGGRAGDTATPPHRDCIE